MFRASALSKARSLSEEAGERAKASDPETAVALWRRALAIREKAEHGGHPEQKADLHALAAALAHAERYAEAETPARAALDAPGIPDGPELALRFGTLATVLKRTDRTEEAEPLARRMVDMLAEGPPTPEYANALVYLAVLLTDLERPEEADPLLHRAIEVKRASVGWDDADYLAELKFLAGLRADRNDFPGATPLYKEALEMMARRSEDGSVEYAVGLANLGWTLFRDGWPKEAEGPLRRSLAIVTEHLGRNHIDRASSLWYLASVLVGLGRHGDAVPLYRERLEIIETVVGEQDEDYESALIDLAAALEEAGRHEEATPLRRTHLDRVRRDAGTSHEVSVQALTALGRNLAYCGDFDAAEPYYREAFEVARRTSARHDPSYSQALNNLAWVIGSAGRYEEAEGMHCEAITLRATAPGEESEPYLDSVVNLAWVLWRTGRNTEAEATIANLLDTPRAAGGPAAPAVAERLIWIARSRGEDGDRDTAVEYYERAVELFSTMLGPTHPWTEAALEELRDYAGDARSGPRRLS